ncbi:MAG TPA: hypothetical protein VL549_10095 [Gemmatimonadales bacterium]|nr:hypothetical protein [Gemmatimonadales bacterium]
MTRVLPLALGAVVIAACGSDSSGPQAGFECLGQALPTTAPAAITLSGQVKKNVLAPVPNPGAIVTAFRTSDTTVALATDTSDTPGRFSMGLTTGGTPVDGYVRVTDSSHITTYAYPAVPLAANDSQNVQMVTPTEFGVLAAAAGITPQAGKGFIGVIVTNCSGTAIAGATVSSTPGGTVVYNAGGVPSAAATHTASDGIAYIANVTAGNVLVQANGGGHTLRAHTVNARADAITLTQIRP